MARDNFKQSVIYKLREGVNLRCSNPSCRVPTSAPAADDKINCIGIAAHICAASPGGPRYDSLMTPENRSAISNAIWLCSNCSIDIDRDEKLYTVEVLHEWKERAQKTARAELGRKLPQHSDAADIMTMALTGFPKTYIAGAISNVHNASAQALENLDPRFEVKTEFSANTAYIKLRAREPISISLSVCGAVTEHEAKFRNFFEHGRDIEIDAAKVSVKDSRLIEAIFSETSGVLSLTRHKITATQKLWLVDEDTNKIELFDDVGGFISHGSKSFTFNGLACENLFCIDYKVQMSYSTKIIKPTISLYLELWEGKSISTLPYFEKLLSLYTKMERGWLLFMSLEVKGIKLLSAEGQKQAKAGHVVQMSNFLHYVEQCRIIAQMFTVDAQFSVDTVFTAAEHQQLTKIAKIIQGEYDYDINQIIGNVTTDLIVDAGGKNVKEIIEMKEPTTITLVQQSSDEVSFFGVTVKLPPLVIKLNSILPKINVSLDDLEKDDVVTIEWIPQKDFGYTQSYTQLGE